jgi:glycine/D-amino acid oxidase-like deaminating enzyme
MDPKRILISGGGIAGLTCAIALQRRGFASRAAWFQQARVCYKVALTGDAALRFAIRRCRWVKGNDSSRP